MPGKPVNAAPAIADFVRLAGKRSGPLPRICLVTGELVGPFKNGGLGTSMTGLVELLGAHGADVTVLYTGEVIGDLDVWKAKYLNAGIKLEALVELIRSTLIGPLPRIGWTNAWHVYEVLRSRTFDVIHFNDTVGEGSYCFVAKKMGLAFQDTLLMLALHSPTEWILESNGHLSNWTGFNCFTSGERLSIANTDVLWGPSLYLLNWITERGYVLPKQVFNQQYVIPTNELFAAGKDKIEAVARPVEKRELRRPKEIVFFGRLEERKGLRLFTNTITRMGPELARRGISVLFMGKPSSVNGVEADKYLAARSSKWPFQWRIESSFDQQQAVKYLQEQDCVAVMASPVDNSPCTVYEALQFRLPFIAARTGGIPELIHRDDHAHHLFDYTIQSLSDALLRALDVGIANAAPAIPVAENQARWLGVHRQWKSLLGKPAPTPKPASWAVFIDHAGSAADAAQTLASVRAALGGHCRRILILQRDLAALDVVADETTLIVDEMSDERAPDLLAMLAASGADNVLVLRSGVSVQPDARETLDRACASGAHLAVPMTALASTDAIMPILPNSASLAMLEGEYDAGGFAYSVKALTKLLGKGYGGVDRTRHYLGLIEEVHGRGGDVWPIPAPLLSVAAPKDLVLMPMSEARRMKAYSTMPALDIYQALTIGRHYYRTIWAVKPPEPPSAISAAVASAVASIPGVNSPETRALVSKSLRAVLGKRSDKAIAKIKGLFS